jgi:hypothetical protein
MGNAVPRATPRLHASPPPLLHRALPLVHFHLDTGAEMKAPPPSIPGSHPSP